MEKNTRLQKKNATEFFAGAKVASPTDSFLVRNSFKESLRQKIYSAYLNNLTSDKMEKTSLPEVVKNNKLVFILSGLFVLLVLLAVNAVLFIPSLSGYLGIRNGKLSANLAYIEGTVQYKSNTDEWKQATQDIDLVEGNSVRVQGNGKAILNVDDGSSIRLASDSSITLVSMDPKNTVISNDSGTIYARVAEAARDFTIKASELSYKSLGTAYKVVNTEKLQGVEVYQNKVEFTLANQEKIVVDQGKSCYIEPKEDGSEDKKVGDLDNENVKKDEFVMWNRDQDKKNEEYKDKLGYLDDLEAPALLVTSPQNGSTTESATVDVVGKTEVGASLTVNGAVAQVNEKGEFSYKFSLKDGANEIKVIAKDKAGNKSVVALTVTKKTATPPVTAGITLSASRVSNGIKFSWSVKGLDAKDGFKLVKSTAKYPTFPGSDYKYLSNSGTRSYTWAITNGTYYHFRVCQYIASQGKCGVYSNDVYIKAPDGGGSVTSLTLYSLGGNSFKWSVSGYSEKGFKLVWSTSPNPTYPGSAYNYYSDPGTRTGIVDASPGTYYVRVCEYLGGTCGKYSNQLTISL